MPQRSPDSRSLTRTGPTRPRRASVDRLFGTHAVAEALRARRRRIDLLRVRRAPWSPEIEAIVAAARRAGIPIREQSRETLDRLVPTGAKTQGVVLDAGPVPELSLRELLRATDSGSRRCLVALDGVEDPLNLGSILRVSEASGACGLLLARRRSPPLSPVVARSSAGALERSRIPRSFATFFA